MWKSLSLRGSSLVVGLCFCISVLATDVSRETRSHHRPVNTPDLVRRPYYIVHACERRTLVISCPPDRFISVAHAIYGRQTSGVCRGTPADQATWDYSCLASTNRALRIVSARCTGRHRCAVPVFNYMFGDPCPHTYKYLEVYYACAKDHISQLSRVAAR